jgi:hypothetical protein
MPTTDTPSLVCVDPRIDSRPIAGDERPFAGQIDVHGCARVVVFSYTAHRKTISLKVCLYGRRAAGGWTS